MALLGLPRSSLPRRRQQQRPRSPTGPRHQQHRGTTHRHDRRRRRARTASVQVNWFYRVVRCVFFVLFFFFLNIIFPLRRRNTSQPNAVWCRVLNSVQVCSRFFFKFRAACNTHETSPVNETAAHYILRYRSPVVGINERGSATKCSLIIPRSFVFVEIYFLAHLLPATVVR